MPNSCRIHAEYEYSQRDFCPRSNVKQKVRPSIRLYTLIWCGQEHVRFIISDLFSSDAQMAIIARLTNDYRCLQARWINDYTGQTQRGSRFGVDEAYCRYCRSKQDIIFCNLFAYGEQMHFIFYNMIRSSHNSNNKTSQNLMIITNWKQKDSKICCVHFMMQSQKLNGVNSARCRRVLIVYCT